MEQNERLTEARPWASKWLVRLTLAGVAAITLAGIIGTACSGGAASAPTTTAAAPAPVSAALIQWSDTFARVKNGEVPALLSAVSAQDSAAIDTQCTALSTDITAWSALPVPAGFPSDGVGLLHQAWQDITQGCSAMTSDTVTVDSINQAQPLIATAQRFLAAA